MNLIDKIEEQMRTDDADRDKQSEELKTQYENASESEKKAIDDALISICGWSLETIINDL